MKEKKSGKYLSASEAFLKACNYCAYQERSHNEVLEKLDQLGVKGLDAEELLLRLIQENFVNEERFAKAFAGGKFRVKKWGRLKIVQELKLRDVSEFCIREALKEIDREDYYKTLMTLLTAKSKTLGEEGPAAHAKLYRYAMSKGYEPQLIWECIRELGGR